MFKTRQLPAFAALASLLILGAESSTALAVDTIYEDKASNSSQNFQGSVSKKARPKVGLALGGGGARGAAHVGVLRILEQQGITIDYIAGTNVGAVVGGLYAAGISLDSMEEMFVKRSLLKAYLTVPLKVRILVIPLFSTSRLIGRKSLDGLYRGNRFRKFLNRYVPESERDLTDLKIPFGAVTFDLIDGEVKVLKEGNLGKVLQASSAIPVLRKPVKMKTSSGDNHLFVDGGVAVNLPVKQVREMGADVVIAVNLNDSRTASKESEFYKVGSVSHRVIQLHLKSIDKEQLENADLVIDPDVDGIGLISSSQKDAEYAIKAGESAALKELDKLHKLTKTGH